MMGRALRLQQAILASPGRSVLCFDFDGASVPIVEHPGDARPHPAALAGLVRCVAVVTGHPVRTVLDLGGFGSLVHAD